MDLGHYILDENHQTVRVPEAEFMRWAYWLQTANRHVKDEHVGPYRVSTLFLGSDQNRMRIMFPEGEHGPPILFETMVFDWATGRVSENSMQERCSTWTEAEAMHERIADAIRKGMAG